MLRSKKYDFFSISKEKVISRNVQPSGIYFIWKNRIQLKEDDQGKKTKKVLLPEFQCLQPQQW